MNIELYVIIQCLLHLFLSNKLIFFSAENFQVNNFGKSTKHFIILPIYTLLSDTKIDHKSHQKLAAIYRKCIILLSNHIEYLILKEKQDNKEIYFCVYVHFIYTVCVYCRVYFLTVLNMYGVYIIGEMEDMYFISSLVFFLTIIIRFT